MPEAETKKADALFADHPQQPLDVVARCTQYGMNRITGLTFEVTSGLGLYGAIDHNRLQGLLADEFQVDRHCNGLSR